MALDRLVTQSACGPSSCDDRPNRGRGHRKLVHRHCGHRDSFSTLAQRRLKRRCPAGRETSNPNLEAPQRLWIRSIAASRVSLPASERGCSTIFVVFARIVTRRPLRFRRQIAPLRAAAHLPRPSPLIGRSRREHSLWALERRRCSLMKRRWFTNEAVGLRGQYAVAVKAEHDDPVVLA